MVNLNRPKENPWQLKTPPGTSEFTMHVEEKDGKLVLVCTVGKTVLWFACSPKRAPTPRRPTNTASRRSPRRTGNLEMCKILLKARADPNAAAGGFPLLFGPVNENHIEVVRLLLASGAKLGEHKQDLVEAAKEPELRALLAAAD